MKFVLLLTCLLLSLNAFSFSGKYSGQGKAMFKSGKSYDCREIFLHLSTTQFNFSLKEGGYNCGDFLKASFDSFSFNIKDGKLFHEGKAYGEINEKGLWYEVFDPEDGSTYRLNLFRTSSGLEYLEQWHDGETTALTVKGTLIRR